MGAKKSSTKKKPPTGKALVIVESPAKARTITKFLGDDFEVRASIGHVRDLPSSSSELPPTLKKSKHARLGVDLDNNFEPIYVVPTAKRDQIKTLKALLKDAPALWLATDEDREGESISWHLVEVLNPKVPVHRLVFHEITRGAILRALETPREIDQDLVKAQESRRILDRLFGYAVSPVLWRKIRPRLSAGRVQSVALRLLVDREMARIAFTSTEFWDLTALFSTEKESFEARLRELADRRVARSGDFESLTGKLENDVHILSDAEAGALAKRLDGKPAKVQKVEEKPYSRKPSPPFTTSTLQQEAGRKLRYPAQRTMRLAQQLYENGAITYMRTDSTALSTQALDAARTLIKSRYGDDYLPDAPRTYKTKVKNAQEAHEAIRPAGSSFQSVDQVRKDIGPDAAKLYELIWKRTVASQMKNAEGRQMTVDVAVEDAVFRATGRTIDFPGYQLAYVESSDVRVSGKAKRDPTQESHLPHLELGQSLAVRDIEAHEHNTQPPARFTEASLVKELDTRGIGRPSTWASIIELLLNREYAFKKGTALVPSYTAFAVVRMLKQHFGDVLDFDFTARMEDDLDSISRGELDGREYLRRFYNGNGQPGLEQLVQQGIDNVDPREVCGFTLGKHGDTEIEVRVGKFGLFVTDGEHSGGIPEDTIPDELTVASAVEILEAAARGPTALGQDPETDKPVYVKSGRFGPYVQLGDREDGADKPKMVSLLPGMEPETLDLKTALRLLELPRDLGPYAGEPKTDEAKDESDTKAKPAAPESVFAHLGRYGPYVKWGSESRSIPADINLLDINLEQAIVLLKQPRRRRGQAAPAKPLRELGAHPDSGAELKILSGRYGPYVTDGDINASLPRGMEPSELTVDEAVVLLVKRAERIKAGGGRKKKTKKAAKKKKKAAKKKAKKTAKKKTSAAKKAGAG